MILKAMDWRLAAIAALLLTPSAAQAGAYVSPKISWSSFSNEPKDSEPTPNFYAYGLDLSGGYSVRQMLDFGLFADYLPGSLKHAQFGKGDATLVSYGGELAMTVAESVYVGLRGGKANYHLGTATDPTELPGKWGGPIAGVALGAVSKLAKTSYARVTFEVMHGSLADQDGLGRGSRKFDVFSVGIAYVYNSRGGEGGAGENTIFRDFLNSMSFF